MSRGEKAVLAAALVLSGSMVGLQACTAVQQQTAKAVASPSGQLFCALATSGGGQTVVGVIEAATGASAGAAAPVAVMAENATKAFVLEACSAAAASAGALAGLPVSPPAQAVPQVAIKLPTAAEVLVK